MILPLDSLFAIDAWAAESHFYRLYDFEWRRASVSIWSSGVSKLFPFPKLVSG